MTNLQPAALRYAELGYRVFPCQPGGKAPACVRGCLEATTDEEQICQWWERQPDANIGLATDGLAVIDVDDATWPADAALAGELARGAVATTPRAGRHCVFKQRPDKPVRNTASRIAKGVDSRGNGGYIVVAPSVVNGKAYRWAIELPPLAELPETPPLVQAELDRVANEAPAAVSHQASAHQAECFPEGERNSRLFAVCCSLRRTGLTHDEILAAALKINQLRCRPPMEAAEVETIAGSAARYEPDAIASAVAVGGDYDDGEPVTSGPADPGPFPPHLLKVPGFIGEVMAHNLACAIRPQPVMALAGALSLLGTLTGRKIRDDLNSRTNGYFVVVADSGAGKDFSRKINRQILYAAGLDGFEGPEELTSDAAIIAALEKSPACLIQYDEFGRLLAGSGDARRNPMTYGIISTLLKLHSSADVVFKAKGYADASKNKVIDQPHLVLHASTVPGSFYGSLTAENILDGFLPRLFIFEAPEMPARQFQPLVDAPASIIEAAQWWGRYEPIKGNMASIHPQPRIVTATPEAKAIFLELAARVDGEMQTGSQEARAIWARVEERAARLALLYAASEDRENSLISSDAAKWGTELAVYQCQRLLYLATLWLSEGAFDARQKRVLRLVEQAGGEISRRDLTKQLHFLTVRERAEAIDNLKATGRLIEETAKGSGAGRPAVVYRLAS